MTGKSDYEYDVFISYCRVGDAPIFLKNHFVPMFEEQLYYALGRKPKVFFDQDLEVGRSWPIELGTALGKSRVLLALWSKPFFASEWCTREVSAMRAREDNLNLRSPENPGGGIIAITTINNGPPPAGLGSIQTSNMKNFFNTRMAKGGALAEGLNQHLMNEAPSVAALIQGAPSFQDNWPIETARNFYEEYFTCEKISQTTRPRYSA